MIAHSTCYQNELTNSWEVALGLTPISATRLLSQDFPEVPQWISWNMKPDPAEKALSSFVGEGLNGSGRIGIWSWERVPCSYGNVGFWSSSLKKLHLGPCWVGMIHITGSTGQSFLLFSYLRFDMTIGAEYLVSTGDFKLLRRFADDVLKHLRHRRHRSYVTVNVIGNQPDFRLKVKNEEKVYLPEGLQQDVMAQVDGFFGGRKSYKKLNIPYKRGFLFTGLPGTGKTMLIRQLIRHVYCKYRVETAYLAVNRRTDANDLRSLFGAASEKKPAMLILEDIESLCNETQLTRSEVLAELDGISQKSGMLLVATANDPSRIDPALTHRPSRFDRVWTFPLPDHKIRAQYLLDRFGNIGADLAEEVAGETEDWTMAYMKELRNTAGILAIKDGHTEITPHHIREALKLLGAQFSSGKKGHADSPKSRRKMGFGCNAAGRETESNITPDYAVASHAEP